jgi:hypothetical protein
MAYVTQDHLRQMLKKALGNQKQVSLAREIGIPPQHLSLMLKGMPIGGKALKYLGYEKAEGLYRKLTA